MSVISKLVGVWAVGKTVSSTSILIQRLLNGLALVVVFTILSCVLLATLILGSFFLIYEALLMHGFSMENSLLIIGGIILALFFILLGVTVSCWKKLSDVPRQIAYVEPSPTDHITSVAEAFINGFLHPER